MINIKIPMLLMMSVGLSACLSASDKKEIRHNQAIYANIQPIVNPNPAQRYELIINTKNAPDDLILKNIRVSYTTKCRFYIGKTKGEVGGNYDLPKYHHTELDFKKINAHEYRADVYDDYLLDKDYFNQGKPCGWYKPSVYALFEPTPNTYRQVYLANVGVNISGLAVDELGNFHYPYYFSLLNYKKPTKKITNAYSHHQSDLNAMTLSPFKDRAFGGEHLNRLASIDIQMIKRF
ncbi:MAG: hypothetical protein Q3971_03315 [Moraxella sp.]|nr:hypothetical protein [Moraxella sp.]